MIERRNVKRREFIDKYFPYVKRMVFRYKRALPVGMEVDDLVNSGIIGLILAADRYEEEKAGKDFMSYANFRIKGEIIGALRTQDRFTRQMRDKIKKYLWAYNELQHDLKRDPSNDEMLEKTGFTQKQMATVSSVMSVNMNDFSSEKISADSVDFFEDVEDLISKISDKEIIHIKLPEAINKLTDQEQHVIKSYFGLEDHDEQILREIAVDLKVTESRVSQIRSQALLKLKDKLNDIKESV